MQHSVKGWGHRGEDPGRGEGGREEERDEGEGGRRGRRGCNHVAKSVCIHIILALLSGHSQNLSCRKSGSGLVQGKIYTLELHRQVGASTRCA